MENWYSKKDYFKMPQLGLYWQASNLIKLSCPQSTGDCSSQLVFQLDIAFETNDVLDFSLVSLPDFNADLWHDLWQLEVSLVSQDTKEVGQSQLAHETSTDLRLSVPTESCL